MHRHAESLAVLLNFYTMLQEYDIIPKEMRAYLRNNGRHFNKKACEWALKNMRKYNENTRRLERIEPMDKTAVDELLKNNGIALDDAIGYDYVYVANMCKADFYGTAIEDERHIALYIKCVIDDADAVSGMIFNRWLADLDTKGIAVDWEELI